MPYGTIKIDTITFTDGGVDKSVPVSGLVQNPTFTGNITVTGTISGNIIQGGTTVSGLTVTGTTANFASGVFTTQISGVTITGTTVSTTTGNFASLTGTTATITSGIIASGTAALPSLAILSDPNTGIYSPGADQLAISTNGTGRLFVDASGNVGINVASPSSFEPGARNLVVGSGSGDNGVSIYSGTANQGIIYFADGTTTAQKYTGFIAYDHSANAMRFGTNDGAERLRITSTGTVNIVGAGTAGSTQAVSFNGSAPVDSLVVDSSGRLLVGTSSAETWYASLAQIQYNGSEASFMAIRNSANTEGGGLYLGKSRGTTPNSATVVQSGDSLGAINFLGADGTDVQTIGAQIKAEVDGTPGANDMPGRLVFSTTADGASSPTERMRIAQNGVTALFSSASSTFIPRSSAAADTSNFLIQGTYGATNTTNGTVSFQVFTNGNVQNTNNSYGAISDIKLKENIVDANPQWDDLKALQVRKYNFKEGQTHTQIGLIAQEVELVSPGLVTESPDRDEDGNDLGTTTKSVNYSVLYMKAVKALQEAMERIETLEASNADLLARVSALESA